MISIPNFIVTQSNKFTIQREIERDANSTTAISNPNLKNNLNPNPNPNLKNNLNPNPNTNLKNNLNPNPNTNLKNNLNPNPNTNLKNNLNPNTNLKNNLNPNTNLKNNLNPNPNTNLKNNLNPNPNTNSKDNPNPNPNTNSKNLLNNLLDGNHQNRNVLIVRKDFDKVFFSKKIAEIQLELGGSELEFGGSELGGSVGGRVIDKSESVILQQDDDHLQQNDFIERANSCIERDGNSIDVNNERGGVEGDEQIQNEIIFYQTNQNEFLSIFDNDSLFHLLLVKDQNLDDLNPTETCCSSGKEDLKKLLFSSQYDLYSLDKNIISLSLEWMDHYSSYITHHTMSKPANPISSSIGSLKSIKLKIEYHIENADCLLKKQMIDLHDSSEMEAQLLWVMKLATMSLPVQEDSTVPEKSARLFLDSWFQKRDASLDFVEDLLWNVFYQSSDKNNGFLHIPRFVFQYVLEKMETTELVPVFERTNKSLFGKEIKEWIIQSSLSGGKDLEKSLQTVFKKFIDHHHEILFNMAICSLQSKLYHALVYHSSKSISSMDLSTLLSDFFEKSQQEQLQILLKLFHISTLQSLVSDYVLGIPQQSLNSLLVPLLHHLHKKDPLQSSFTIYLETELPKFDTASLQVVKGICDRLVPDYWMATFQHPPPSSSSSSSSLIQNNQDTEQEFVFLIRSENDEDDQPGENEEEEFPSSHDPHSVKYKKWIARLKKLSQISR